MTGYQALANGIIEQAAKDYRAALKTLRRHPDSKAAMATAICPSDWRRPDRRWF